MSAIDLYKRYCFGSPPCGQSKDTSYAQAHGKLLQLKALVFALGEAGQHRALTEILPEIATVISLSEAAQCPALISESLKVGQTVLDIASRSSSQGSGVEATLSIGTATSPREMSEFCESFKSSCREALRTAQCSFQLSGLAVAEELCRSAIRPALIESAASGLLEAAATMRPALAEESVASEMHSKETQASTSARSEGLSKKDLDLLLQSPAEVQRAALKHLRQMLSEGKIAGQRLTSA